MCIVQSCWFCVARGILLGGTPEAQLADIRLLCKVWRPPALEVNEAGYPPTPLQQVAYHQERTLMPEFARPTQTMLGHRYNLFL